MIKFPLISVSPESPSRLVMASLSPMSRPPSTAISPESPSRLSDFRLVHPRMRVKTVCAWRMNLFTAIL